VGPLSSCENYFCEDSSEPAAPTHNALAQHTKATAEQTKHQTRTANSSPISSPIIHRLIHTRTINPTEAVVERAVPRLHRSPTRKTLPPGDTHRSTTDTLPIRLPIDKGMPIPQVIIIITITVRKRARPGRPAHHIHQPRHNIRNLKLVEHMGLAKPRHAREAKDARATGRTRPSAENSEL
jgi:hypothetical protein